MIFLPVASGTRVSDNMILLPLADGGAVHRYMIDEIGAAGGAYSFQLLSADFAGPLVRIRRASDDSDHVFFAVDGIGVDNAEITAFLDGTTGFVSIWFDQSGNEFDLVQATTGSQPQVLQDANGYWYANCTQKFLASGTFMGAQTNSTLQVIWQCQSDGAISVTSPQGGINLGSGNNIFVPFWTTEQSPTYKGTQQTSFNWCDNKPRQHIVKFLNGTWASYEYASDGRTPYTLANPVYDALSVGASLVDGNLRVYELVVFPIEADEDTIFEVTKNNYPQMFVTDTLWLNMGDSNTAAGFSHLGANWTCDQIADQPITVPYYSRAHGGRTIQNFLDHPEDVTFYLENFTYSDAKAIIFLGTNDLVVNGTTGADAYDMLCELGDILRNAGAVTVAAITMLPRTADAPFATERVIFNNLLIANAAGAFDIVINTTTNPNLQNQNDTTYFADTTHLNDAGQAQLAAMVVDAF